jgi:tetratricopeptide (TPR) repeat protein
LLTHYFTFEPSRRGQLDRFVADLAKGLEPLVAARQEFGDLDKLNHDLNSYLQRSKLQYVKISPAALKLGPIEVTKLSAPASAALPFVAALKNDPDAKEAGIISDALGTLEGRANGDTFVEVALAEANLDAAKFDAAEAAADRALTASPGSTEAMILKGRARIERAAKAKAPEAEFNEARNWLLKANKIDPEDPEPLYEFYNSFVKEGVAPNQNAIDALHYASDLAPQDESVRLLSAGQYVADGRLKEARSALVVVAYDPHGQKLAATARDMIGKIDAGDATGALKAAGWTVDPHPHR